MKGEENDSIDRQRSNMKKSESYTELLPPYDRLRLDDLEVELEITYAKFNRELNEKELREVWRIFAALQYHLGERDDRINWALGDWQVKVVEWYGERTLAAWMPWMLEDLGLAPHRADLYRQMGGTLVRLQSLEDVIKECCTIIEFTGLSLSVDDLFSLNDKLRKRTLGQLVNIVKDRVTLDIDFESRLSTFVDDRNKFIHRLWSEEIRGTNFDHPLLSKLANFTLNLFDECNYFLHAFTGFRLTLSQQILNDTSSVKGATTPAIDLSYGRWEQEAIRIANTIFINIKPKK